MMKIGNPATCYGRHHRPVLLVALLASSLCLTARAVQPPTPAETTPAETAPPAPDELPAPADAAASPVAQASAEAPVKPDQAAAAELPGLVPLTPEGKAWIDRQRKLVVVDGEVVLRRGTLEMFACPKQTKEHESIVAVDVPASVVHAGLLAVGAKAGTPVKFRPAYQPPTGTEIEIWVLWRDQDGKPQKVKAQQWIRNARTGTALEYPWVFAGSGFWQDEQAGVRRYHGDAGDFICVSNFPTATLDIPVESTQSDAALLYEAFTDRIPAVGTKIRLVLSPKQATN